MDSSPAPVEVPEDETHETEEEALEIEQEEEIVEEPRVHESPSKQRPADWYKHEYKEGEDEVDVGTESVPYKESLFAIKMYNVAIQVGPRRKPARESQAQDKPKQFDVGIEVGPTDFVNVIHRPMSDEELGEDWEYVGEESDEMKDELKRRASLRADAMTLARPAFYRELPLSSTLEDALVQPKDNQVSGHDIEQEDAARRGINLEKNNILWPTAREFDFQLGERKVEDYIRRCWKLDKEWMYHTRLIQTHTTDYRKKYIYEVVFSTPTQDCPVPPATASVFFVIEILKYGSIEEAIKVSYVLEGTRYPHTPGKIPFQQKWLQGIVADKLSIQRRIDF